MSGNRIGALVLDPAYACDIDSDAEAKAHGMAARAPRSTGRPPTDS